MLRYVTDRKFVLLTLNILSAVLFTNLSVAEPAKIFRSVISAGSSSCQDMKVRFPSFFPNSGIKLYAHHKSESIPGCVFWISTSSDSSNYGTTVNPVIVSSIIISKTYPVIHSERPISNREQVSINPKINGTYLTALHGTNGFYEHVVWQQDRLFFHVQSRMHSQQEVIDIARSMAREKPIQLRKIDRDRSQDY